MACQPQSKHCMNKICTLSGVSSVELTVSEAESFIVNTFAGIAKQLTQIYDTLIAFQINISKVSFLLSYPHRRC